MEESKDVKESRLYAWMNYKIIQKISISNRLVYLLIGSIDDLYKFYIVYIKIII